MDYTALTAAIDFAGALTVAGTAAAALAVVYVGIKGAKLALSFIR